MKKILLIGIGVLVVLSFLFGFNKNKGELSTRKVEELFIKEVTERYGVHNNFTIKNVKPVREGTGPIKGDIVGYEARIILNDGRTFIAFIDKNGNNYKDKYGEMLFDKEISELINQQISNIPNIKVNYENTIYFYEEKIWTQGQVEKFLRESSTYVTFNVEIDSYSVDDAANKVQEVERLLTNKGIKFMGTFKYKNKTFTYSKSTANSQNKTLNDIKLAFTK